MVHGEDVGFQQFDQVMLRTTKNVKYLSAPPGTTLSPHGVWSVVAIIREGDICDLLLAKQTAIVRIPAVDVLKISTYDIKAITHPLGKLTDGEGRQKS